MGLRSGVIHGHLVAAMSQASSDGWVRSFGLLPAFEVRSAGSACAAPNRRNPQHFPGLSEVILGRPYCFC